MVQIVIVRVKEFQIIEVPVFIRLQELDVVTGREAGACILRMVQAEAPAAAENAASRCSQQEDPFSTQDPRAVRPKRKPVASKVLKATETVSDWRVAGARRSTTPWQLAEKQHSLAGKIWSAQRREQQRVQQAIRLQVWWRNRLAVKAREATAKGNTQALHVLRRAVYKAASAKEEPIKLVIEQTDDEILALAIQQAKREEAAMLQALQPVLEGAKKAMRYMVGAECPDGHALQVTIVPMGTTCGVCGGTNLNPEVVIACKGGTKCGFVSCARQPGCAPRDLIRVMTALDIKHKLRLQQDAGSGSSKGADGHASLNGRVLRQGLGKPRKPA